MRYYVSYTLRRRRYMLLVRAACAEHAELIIARAFSEATGIKAIEAPKEVVKA